MRIGYEDRKIGRAERKVLKSPSIQKMINQRI